MRQKSIVLLLLLTLPYMLILLPASAEVSKGIIVNSGETIIIRDRMVILNGNIEVRSGGCLYLINSTVLFNLTFDGQYGIKVYPGGILYILSSFISSYNELYGYYFVAENESVIVISDSVIACAGYSYDNPGFVLKAPARIVNTTFIKNYVGLNILSTENVSIEGCSFYHNWSGLVVASCSNVNVTNCIFAENSNGIEIRDSRNIIVENSTFENNGNIGIFAGGADKLAIANSTVSGSATGISVAYSQNVLIYLTKVYRNNGPGINIAESINLLIQNCSISDNEGYGIQLLNGLNITLAFVNFTNDILFPYGTPSMYYSLIIANSTVNGRPILYYYAPYLLSFNGTAGQLIVAFGVVVFINSSHLYSAMLVSCNNVTILNSTIEAVEYGVILMDCEFIYVTQTKIFDGEQGILINSASKAILAGCQIVGCKKQGISVINADTLQISSCWISGCEYGAYLANITGQALLFHNWFYRNYCGVSVDQTVASALIYQNNFIENDIQAVDLGSVNWDNGTIGNFWSDYAGPDDDGNGIGDTPYRIDADSVDNKPLLIPAPKARDNNPPKILGFYISPSNPEAGEKVFVSVLAEDDKLLTTGILEMECGGGTEYIRMNAIVRGFTAQIGPFYWREKVTIRARIYDVGGNMNVTEEISFAVNDTTPPEILSVKLSSSNITVGSEVTIEVEVTDGEYGSGIDSVVVYYSNDGGKKWLCIEMPNMGGRFVTTIGPACRPGSIILYVVAKDRAGNSASSSAYYITVTGTQISEPSGPSLKAMLFTAFGFAMAVDCVVMYLIAKRTMKYEQSE